MNDLRQPFLKPYVDTGEFSTSVYIVEDGMPLDIASVNTTPNSNNSRSFYHDIDINLSPDGKVTLTEKNRSDTTSTRHLSETLSVARAMICESMQVLVNEKLLSPFQADGAFHSSGYIQHEQQYDPLPFSFWHTNSDELLTIIGIDEGSVPTMVLNSEGQTRMPKVTNNGTALGDEQPLVITDEVINSFLGDGFLDEPKNMVPVPTGRVVIAGPDVWQRSSTNHERIGNESSHNALFLAIS